MRLGIRLLFAFFLINGIAAFFVLRVFTAEIKPSVREVMEDMMVDTANILAELASDDLVAGRLEDGAAGSAFAQHVRHYATRPIDAAIWGFSKQSLDYRIYVTDATGRVLFDSENRAVGADYSQWRDVARTLRGEYGARSTRDVEGDDTSGVMHVAAPIYVPGTAAEGRRIAGVLTVAKPTRTVQRFIDRAENKVLASGVLLLVLSAAVGVAVTLWMVWNVRRLRDYALSVQGPAAGDHDSPPPRHWPCPRCRASWATWPAPWTACARGWRGATTSKAMCAPSPTSSRAPWPPSAAPASCCRTICPRPTAPNLPPRWCSRPSVCSASSTDCWS